MITSSQSAHRHKHIAIGIAIAISMAAAPVAQAQSSCLTTRGLVMTANIGPVAVSGHLATILQHGNWDTRPTARFAMLTGNTAVEIGNWKAVWSVEDVELRASTAFVVADDRLIAIDLRDPATPVEFSHVDLVNAERVAIAGTRAHVLSTAMDGNPHLDIIEISNPSEMERRGSIRWDPADPEPVAIAVDAGFVTIADEDGIFVIDARDPWNPIRGGRWSGEAAGDVASIGRIAVISPAASDNPSWFGIRLVDFTQSTNPVERGSWEAPSEVVSVVRFGSNAAVATTGHGVFVIDLQDPNAPVAIDHWDGFGLGAVGLSAAWPNLVIANNRIGLIVLGLKPECLPPRLTTGRLGS